MQNFWDKGGEGFWSSKTKIVGLALAVVGILAALDVELVIENKELIITLLSALGIIGIRDALPGNKKAIVVKK